MPRIERVPIKVTLVVEADGHRLEFSETTTADGGRNAPYDPVDPSLEQVIQVAVDACIARVHDKAMNLVNRAWVVVGDDARA